MRTMQSRLQAGHKLAEVLLSRMPEPRSSASAERKSEGIEMTQEQAYQQLQALFPGEYITVSRERTIRTGREPHNYYWLHADTLPNHCISSERSWKHLIAIAKSGNESCWAEVDEEVEAQ
jgi:hypothetical protein